MLRHFGMFVVASTVSLFCLSAPAQTDSDGSVSGTGRIVLQSKATALRVQLNITVRGDDMEQTLKLFERKGEAVRGALAKADAKSIKLENPRLVGGLRTLGNPMPLQQQYWGNQKAMQQQVPRQYPSQPPALAPIETKRGHRITMQVSLTAEWPLQPKSIPELLVEADRIVLRVHKKLKQFMPPESSSPNKPIDSDDEDQLYSVSWPQYVFVGRIDRDKIQQAQAEAFKKARDQAAAVAKVAGYRIGSLLTVSIYSSYLRSSDPFASSSPPFAAPTPYLPSAGSPSRVGSSIDLEQIENVEVTALNPSNLDFHTQIHATFRLLEPLPRSKTSN